jgi:hypothetical protein
MKKIVILCLLVISCSSCSSEKEGMDKLRELCEKDAGLIIYKTVEADGYYDAYANSSIAGRLVKSEYKFFEFCDDAPSRFNMIPDAGCFRVKRVRRDSGQCNKKIDERLSEFIVDPYPEFLKKFCISVEKIDKPMARYSYHSNIEIWTENNSVSEFIRSNVYIEEKRTNEVLGRYVSYSYNVRPGRSTAKSCEIFEGDYPSFVESNFVNTVIQLIKE